MKLNVVITSGGTREYIDDVRVMTNISSGRLGAKIASNFINHGHNVTYIQPFNAVNPGPGTYDIRIIKDTNSVLEVMEELVPKADVVIQAMAVSDFTFDLNKAMKVSSEDPEAFVEHIRTTIRKTPKIISKFRKWNPNAVLVGFKFTVGKSYAELEKIAIKLLEDNELDMVLANDKSTMQTMGEHVATLITKVTGLDDYWRHKLRSKDEIAGKIYDNVKVVMGKR